MLYNNSCCDIDSVEARGCCKELQVFRGANVKLGNWRQVTVQLNNLQNAEMTVVKLRAYEMMRDTHGDVYSHHLLY